MEWRAALIKKGYVASTKSALLIQLPNGDRFWHPRKMVNLEHNYGFQDGDDVEIRYNTQWLFRVRDIGDVSASEMEGLFHVVVGLSNPDHAELFEKILDKEPHDRGIIFKTPLLDYQLDVMRERAALDIGALFLDMGTGKTRIALELANIKEYRKLWWVCPASLMENLKADIKKHVDGSLRVDIVSLESLSSIGKNYLRLREEVAPEDMVIVDESLFIKNIDAKRTKNMIGIFKNVHKKYILNGTPISKNLSDIFTQMLFLSPEILGYKTFDRFAAAHVVWDEKFKSKIKKILNEEHIYNLIKPFCSELSLGDVVKMPPKTYTTSHVYLPDAAEVCFTDALERFMEELDKEYVSEARVFRLITQLQEITCGNYNGLHTIEHKASALHKFMQCTGLIFVKYVWEIEEITKLYPDCYRITGEMPLKKRAENIELSKTDKKPMILTYGVGGFGLNLQHYCRVLLFSQIFDLAKEQQSEARVYRIGQTQDVEIHIIHVSDGIDGMIAKNINSKQDRQNSLAQTLKNKKNLVKYIENLKKDRAAHLLGV